MAFTTVEKVKSMFRNLTLDGSASALTTAEVQLFIDEASAVVSSCLKEFYDMDNVGTNSALILSRIETFKVADIVDDILNNYSEASQKPFYGKKAEKLLEKYIPRFNEKSCEWCDPMAKLPDTPYKGLPSTTTQVTIKNTAGPTFKKGVDSW